MCIRDRALNVLENQDRFKDQEAIRCLLFETSDIRHILKTLSDVCLNPAFEGKKIHFYFCEKNKENLARANLLFQTIQQADLSARERMELFLDLFGNALIREKSAAYLDSCIKDLMNLVSEDPKTKTPLKQIFDFAELKFKERDEVNDAITSWSSKVPFQMESLRDQRLRHHDKERYDHRVNLIDWDCKMNLNRRLLLLLGQTTRARGRLE
eukprot:TRINITY_DN5984_c0_g1_i7.p1 TRINITY_DN5984_c0_g1~~TRINITY_DN5984_c0_g1_i7.p1  ORF type:complete len:211 (-),score=26.46 TRINITY_DN5984_c0_g1_i7:505-1137(-)